MPVTDACKGAGNNSFVSSLSERGRAMKKLGLIVFVLVTIAALVFSVHKGLATRTSVGNVSDISDKPVAGAMIQVVVVHGREAQIQEEGTFLTKSDSDGRFKLELMNGNDKRFRILATKEGYEPESTVIDGYASQGSLSLVLKSEIPSQPRQYKVGDKVIARDGEWCNGEIVSVGTSNSPTNVGARDMTGRVEVRWDDWDTTQWLPERQVKPRPPVPLTSPVRCPSISKQELAERFRGSVNKLLGR